MSTEVKYTCDVCGKHSYNSRDGWEKVYCRNYSGSYSLDVDSFSIDIDFCDECKPKRARKKEKIKDTEIPTRSKKTIIDRIMRR